MMVVGPNFNSRYHGEGVLHLIAQTRVPGLKQQKQFGKCGTYSVGFPKTKLSTVRPTHRTIATIPSTSILPPLFVRVSVLLLTPISAPTCAQDIPRERRWASIASNRAIALNLPGEVILMPPCSQACAGECNIKGATGYYNKLSILLHSRLGWATKHTA